MSNNDYWCLFCGEDALRWKSLSELFNHMIKTVHKDDSGNIVFFAGENND